MQKEVRIEITASAVKPLFDSNVSYHEIALRLGVSEGSVISFCRKNGWTRERKYGPPKKEAEKFCSFCKAGMSAWRTKFCSKKCQSESAASTRRETVSRWLAGENVAPSGDWMLTPDWVRFEMLERSCHKCSKCGWDKVNPRSGKSPLELNHIDGDCLNNRINNLEILCPNCHSLTENYRALNYKNSRKPYRMIRSERNDESGGI